ncbi:Ubiquinone biosynthesis O-methyltransferase [Commensalibacter sp. Nvir]|uniref:bifunctional 2-polyprenyl-6-hydroxyphenol methylase/3-demethylubiquinol 3-O-methyltransferase UbiG n=1 Tax=Commensalibacter sp. Nvir TaxID=3069817 RepID=UPI002D7553F2|nr:Ubiquinone biosynthesis O-methyltransferase [Commensalibacter sp. Nvir]
MSIVTPSHGSDQNKSIIENEINHFNALSQQWWDHSGPMKTLHDMNDLRISWIDNKLKKFNITKPQKILDIGCGAGLASESLAKLGYDIVGIDAGEEVIKAAQSHLDKVPLPQHSGKITYRIGCIEELDPKFQRFSIVIALELLEHVKNPHEFIQHISNLLTPTGKVFISTINRNLKSYFFAKVGAEYVTRLLPVGTHNWKQFVTPNELRQMAHQAGLRIVDIAGLTLRLNGWKITKHPSINYITCLSKN